MRQLTAFIGKEWMENLRTGKILIFVILFSLFGIMNPAFAKLTPWLMETMAESLEESGLMVTNVEVDALTSWTQFYKNIPIALLVFLLMYSGNMAAEYQRGTLINMVTKGISRWKIVMAKFLVMAGIWTAAYWLCYGITYFYNAYFWDNGIVSHVVFSAACIYLLGLWLLSLMMLFSAFLSSNSAVSVSTLGAFMVFYVFGMLPKVKKFLPVKLLDASKLLMQGEVKDFQVAVIITVGLILVDVVVMVLGFDKRRL